MRLLPTLQPATSAGAALVAMLLAGCAPVPPAAPAAPALATAYARACEVAARPGAAAPLARWWQGYGDAALSALVDRALAASPSIEQATARLAQASAAADAAGAALAPQAELQAARTAVRQSLLDPNALVASASPAYRRSLTEDQLGAGARWNLDLAGGDRARRDAARADARAEAARADRTRAAVVAQVADRYLGLRGAQERLALLDAQEEVAARLATLVRQRADAGAAAARELDNALAALEAVRANRPPLRQAVQADALQLDLLLGAAPGSTERELSVAGSIPAVPGVPTNRSPADLLRRRPDVRAAELRLAAQHARVAATLADYYPQVSLSTLLGWRSAVAGRLLEEDAAEGRLVLGLRWRLFDFGRLDAEAAAARGREAEALAAYRAAVLGAATEVETAFGALLEQERRAAVLERQAAHLDAARRRTQQAYADGAVSLLEVLDLDRQKLAAADQRAQAREAAARAAAAAYLALGGGSPADADADAVPATQAPACGAGAAGTAPFETTARASLP